MKTANRSIHPGRLTIPGLAKPALILLAAAMLLLLLAVAQPAAAAESIDYDTDDDGLIEIRNLAQLDAVRWDLNGDGQPDPAVVAFEAAAAWQIKSYYGVAWPKKYAENFPNAASGMGCPDTGCKGYELEANLDFDSNGDGKVTADDHNGAYWGYSFSPQGYQNAGWWPIGWWPYRFSRDHASGYGKAYTYRAVFEGNGHTIDNLFINRDGRLGGGPGGFQTTPNNVGLFYAVDGGSGKRVVIRNVGLTNVSITVTDKEFDLKIGSLAGSFCGAESEIVNVFATGKISQLPEEDSQGGGTSYVGGLVGSLCRGARIVTSYSSASVDATRGPVGGLVGAVSASKNQFRHSIIASYATGPVSTAATGQLGSVYYAGGLAGHAGNRSVHGVITASYATGRITIATLGSYHVGGLIGGGGKFRRADGILWKDTATNSYYDKDTAGMSDARAGRGVGKTTSELQAPTGYTGIYAEWNLPLGYDEIPPNNWNVDFDYGGTPDDPWDFGTASDYPVLKVDFNGDGKATWEEFGSQRASQGATPNSETPEEQAAAAHPEVYKEAEYGLKVACSDVQKFHAKLTFDLGGYTGKLALSLSLWGSSSYLSYESHGLKTPALHRNGKTASVEISTHPPKTRFRLDTPDGRNLLLGYADCRTDAPALDEDGNPPPPPPKTPEERAAEDNKEVYEADNGNGDDAPMSVSCEVGDDSATLTFNLGSHSGAVQLTLMQWDGVVFRSYAALGLTAPALQRNGQTATVEIPTHTPERVRFRLDSQYGRNLLLGYADCHEDTPGPVTEVTEETPEETVTPVEPVTPGPVPSAAATLPPAATAANREVYADAGRAMAVSCTGVTNKGATLIFDLGSYTRSLTMTLSLWDGTVFRSYASQNIAQPDLEREGQKATVSITTNPALTRFRLDSDLGTNLLLGYADCRNDPS